MPNQSAQEVIDAELVDSEARCLLLQKHIQELKTRRNTYAPISKLPDEVLLEIFAFAQKLYPQDRWYREVTHVCRRWRYTAIDAPTLWTNPPLSHHRFAMLMLERSKSADLTAFIGTTTTIATIEHVIDCIGRIKDLRITLDIEVLDSLLSLLEKGDQKASHLRRFGLECWSDEPWDAQPMFGLSATVFCQFRLLRELNIYNIIFDWNVLPLPNLVDLRLVKTTFPTRISIQQLLDTLRQMPHLEHLTIPLSQSLLLPPSTTEMRSVAQVTLSRLGWLIMGDSHMYTDYIGWFLSKMTLPRLRYLLMDGEPPLSGITPTNYHSVSPQTIQGIASSVMGGDFGTFSSLEFSRENLYLETRHTERSNDTPPYVDFNIQAQEPPDHDAARLFMQISVDILLLCRASLSHVVKLVLQEGVLLTVDELFHLSTVLPSVREIEILNSSTTDFISVLASLPSHPPSDTDTFTPFPRLNSVHFSSVDFASNPSLLEALCNSLMLRSEYDVAIPKLDLYNCQISSGQLALLEEIVVDVKSRKPTR